MLHKNLENREQKAFVEKRSYLPPRLICYGAVRDLTRAGGQGSTEDQAGNSQNCSRNKPGPCIIPSSRDFKQNIVLIGVHRKINIGLYLFDYKPEYRDQWGHGRQFGVMADEVEKVMPEAVCLHPDGYKMVDYGMLGISRNLH